MSAAVIIPARYASSRFPGKALALLNGKPLVQHVYERAGESTLADEVLVATDSREILDAVASFGGRAVMTSPEHATGTDRIAEAAAGTGYDIIVNVQGVLPYGSLMTRRHLSGPLRYGFPGSRISSIPMW
jgi:3-deoxy-manno-octulosonate cytidylyltransferase (CMP-KDO synthetase)